MSTPSSVSVPSTLSWEKSSQMNVGVKNVGALTKIGGVIILVINIILLILSIIQWYTIENKLNKKCQDENSTQVRDLRNTSKFVFSIAIINIGILVIIVSGFFLAKHTGLTISH